uniref:(California timema) hypothetical protein n=1 Tax=Timema californicum TaxID=61474 RepID=A0A7R9IWD7_TIMCA|nr:unnamed protein product [Timema californicum]
MKRLGPNAHPFTMEMTPLAPPSVQLVPAKEYSGAPIGTSYDVRAYIGKKPSSPERDSNLELPVLGRLAQHETSALTNYNVEAGPIT